jgi:hypothetical protein
LAYVQFAAALAMVAALYIGTNPKWWGWLLFSPLFLVIFYEGLRTYTYSVTVDGDRILLGGFKRSEFRVSEIVEINVWFAKGGRIAVINFADLGRLSVPSRLADFNKLVDLLRTQAKLPEPEPARES